MTCASCAVRIEKKLNRLDGVTATVNFATEKARVSVPAGVTQTILSGRWSRPVTPPPCPSAARGRRAGPPGHGAPERSRLLRRLLVSRGPDRAGGGAGLGPALQFRYYQWVPGAGHAGVGWGAWPFHKAAWANARHRAATMDTLISVGVTAAYLWSLYALFFGRRATWPAHRLRAARAGAAANATYLDVAAGVTVLVLLGRYLEARAKRRSGAALRALLSMGAKDVAVLRDGAEVRVPASAAGRR